MSISEEKKGEKAFNLHTQVIENEKLRRELFLQNIILLEEMRNQELYKDILGDEKAKWSGYLGELEIFYSRWKVQRWIFIHQKLMNELGCQYNELLEIPESRLEEVARVAIQDNVKDLLDKAKILLSLQWKDTLAELKGKPTSEICSHEFQKYEVCKTCGIKHESEE